MTVDDDTRAAWLAWRRDGIGASEIAAVCGRNPWASPLSVYLRKRGESTDDVPPTEAMRLGLALEDLVADEFHLQTGLHVVGRQTWCVHPAHPEFRATVDGFAAEHPDAERPDVLGIVETKTTGDLARFDPVPEHVVMQVQWQMYVTGELNAWVAVLGGGYRLGVRVLEVPRNDRQIAAMASAATAFWGHVQAGEPPDVTAYSPGDAGDLAAAYPDPEPGTVADLGDDAAEHVAELRALKDVARSTAERITTAENWLKARLGDNEAGSVDGETVVTWKPVTSKRIDTKRLLADEPTIAYRYQTTSTARRFLLR